MDNALIERRTQFGESATDLSMAPGAVPTVLGCAAFCAESAAMEQLLLHEELVAQDGERGGPFGVTVKFFGLPRVPQASDFLGGNTNSVFFDGLLRVVCDVFSELGIGLVPLRESLDGCELARIGDSFDITRVNDASKPRIRLDHSLDQVFRIVPVVE